MGGTELNRGLFGRVWIHIVYGNHFLISWVKFLKGFGFMVQHFQ